MIHLALILAPLLLAQEQGQPSVPVAAVEFSVDSSPSGLAGSFVTHRDGSLLYFSSDEIYQSTDGGRSWTGPKPLPLKGVSNMTVRDVLRLKSGKLGLLAVADQRSEGNFSVHRLHWWTSNDEGKTWQGPVVMNPTGQSGLPYSGGAMLQMARGRLVLPVRTLAHAHRKIAEAALCKGRVGGVEYSFTEHARYPEFEAAFCYLSDDDGQTWSRSKGDIMIWLDQGRGGAWPMDEPCVVELAQGRLALFGRTTLGRIYRALSVDGGLHWAQPEATELASSYSPARIVRLPETGDLLCVWNQVSATEITQGFWRSRLSCAISRDDGESWQSFKVIDHQGLPPVGRIKSAPPAMVRPAGDLGDLPHDYGNVSYPTIGFFGDQVLLRYKRRVFWPKRKNSDRFLIIPTEWFYR
jgi:BNR repeat protein